MPNEFLATDLPPLSCGGLVVEPGRCLPPEVTHGLAADLRFALPNWQVAAVVESKVADQRWITADEAVEWRVDKSDPALLLVDATTAGAGMDGNRTARQLRCRVPSALRAPAAGYLSR